MDKQKSISILEALANGENPVNGKPLPGNSPYQNAEVTRALFYALSTLRSNGTAQQPLQRQGEPWSAQEDEQLRQGLINQMEVPELAKTHQRTHGAIRSRIKHLGLVEVKKLR